MNNISKLFSLVLSFSILLGVTQLKAQTVASYNFAQSVDSYVPLTGATVLRTGTIDNSIDSITLPTPFYFAGLWQSKVYITSNGIVSFPNANGVSAMSASTYLAISGTLTSTGGTIGAYSRDLQGADATSTISHAQVANEYVFQWSNYRRYNISGESMNFQVRLDLNNGTVKIVYGNMTPGTSSTYGEVGIRGASTSDYNNRAILIGTGAWTNSTAGTSNSATCYFNSTTPATTPQVGTTFSYTLPSCIPASNLTASNITSNSADLMWTYIYTVPTDGYEYYVSTTSVTPASTATGVTSMNAGASLSNLTPNTTYYVWVRSLCSSTDISAWSVASSFRTLCTATNIPYTQNFESVTTPAVPSCVTTASTSGNLWSTTTVSSNKMGRYVFHSTQAADSWMYIQGLNLTAGQTYRLSYKYYKSNATANEMLKVAMGTSATASAMTTILATHSPITVATLTPAYVDFVAPSTGVFYIGFNAFSAVNLYTIYVDDITVDLAPTCVEPTAVVASNLTSTSVDLSWTAPNAVPANGYEYYYSTTNTAPTASTAGTSVTGSSTTIGSLLSNTTYYVWVRSACSSTDMSFWTNVITFKTPCSIESAPTVLQNFAHYTGVANVGVSLPCWSEGTSAAATPFTINPVDGKWTTDNWRNAGTDSTARINLYGTNIDWLISNPIDLGSTANTYRLKYSYALTSYNVTTSPASYSTHVVDVLVSTDGGQTWTANNIIKTHSGAYNISDSLVYIDLAYTGVIKIAFRATTSSLTPDLDFFIDNFIVEPIPSCVEPTAINTVNITENSATLSWTAPNTAPANGYEYYVSTTSVTPASTEVGTTVATTSVTIPSLTDNTTYYVWVRSVCLANDKSVWSRVSTFRTLCTATNIPYTQNFESVTTPALPSCVTTAATSGNLWSTTTVSSNKMGRYVFHSTQDADSWMYIQGLNLTAGQTYRLSYKYYKSTSTANEMLKVAIGTSATASAMTTILATHSPITVATLTPTYVDFVAPSTGVFYIGFNAFSALNLYTIYVDDITVDLAPTCVEPTAIVASNPTSNSIDVSWTAPNAVPANGYEYYYSTTNTAPTASTAGTSVTGISTTIGSLLSNTTYYVWVRSACSSTEMSSWTNVITFKTLCSIESAPTVLQNFANYNGLANDGVSLPCWSEATSVAATPFTLSATTTSRWNYEVWRNSGNNRAAYINLYGTNIDWLISNAIDLGSTANTYRLKYSYALNNYDEVTSPTSYSTHVVEVIVSTDGGQTWTANNIIKTHSGAYNRADTSVIIDLAYSGVVKIAFRATTSSFTPDLDFFIDNFVIEAIPSCAEPTALAVTNITASSSDISWTAPSAAPANGYEYYISTTNTAPTASTVGTAVTGTSVTLSNLTENTAYYVWVRSICSTTDASIWSNMLMFRTPCVADNVPYLQNFESVTTPAIPECTSVENLGNGNIWHTASALGSKVLRYSYSSSYSANTWFYTKGINLTAGTSYRISYINATSSIYSVEKLKVAYGTTPSSSAMTTVLADHNNIDYTAARDTFIDFVPTTSGVYYFGFHAYSGADEYALYVDDIFIQVTPTCFVPTNATISGITLTSADVSWTAPNAVPANGYEYYYSTTDVAPTTAGTAVTGTSVTLSNLVENTIYYVWIRSVCSATDASTWVRVPNFNTGHCIPTGTTSYYMRSIVTTNATTNINYTTSTASVYTDNSATELAAYPNTPIGFTLTPSQGTNVYYIWVDWNNDLDFADAGETILATTNYTSEYIGTLTIPSTTPVGSYRMRVAQSWSGSITSACGPAPYGSFTDFTLNILPTCSAPITLSTSVDNICSGSQGSATVVASSNNASAAYTYEWSNGQTTATATGLALGSHTVTVTDSASCSETATVEVLSSIISAAQGTIEGDCGIGNGSAQIIGIGTNLTYTWSNGQTTATATGLAAGTYTVIVADAICSITLTVEIPSIVPFTVAADITDELTTNPANGAIEITAPLQDVTYSWSNGATTSTITGLSAGMYSVTVTDVNGCFAIASFEVKLITSVDDVALAAIKVYPNPTTSLVNVAGLPADSKVMLINNLGQVVLSFVSQNDVEQIDLSNLAPSTYWIRVENQNSFTVLPVVRMK